MKINCGYSINCIQNYVVSKTQTIIIKTISKGIQTKEFVLRDTLPPLSPRHALFTEFSESPTQSILVLGITPGEAGSGFNLGQLDLSRHS